jgi:lipopolysaccharide biosynthesis regulator YciM
MKGKRDGEQTGYTEAPPVAPTKFKIAKICTFLAQKPTAIPHPANDVLDHYDQLSTEQDYFSLHYHLDNHDNASTLQLLRWCLHTQHGSPKTTAIALSILASQPETLIVSFSRLLDSQIEMEDGPPHCVSGRQFRR